MILKIRRFLEIKAFWRLLYCCEIDNSKCVPNPVSETLIELRSKRTVEILQVNFTSKFNVKILLKEKMSVPRRI